MDAALRPIVAALADLDDGELAALIEATNEAPQIAPGLLAWLEHAADWERHRRAGMDFPLQPPVAATPPEEDSISIDAAVIVRAQFAQDERVEARAVVRLFGEVAAIFRLGFRVIASTGRVNEAEALKALGAAEVIDRVMAPKALCEQAWARLAQDLDLAKLDSLVREIPLAAAIDAHADILAGKLRGRLVVNVNA